MYSKIINILLQIQQNSDFIFHFYFFFIFSYGPQFDDKIKGNITNVTVQAGSTAALNCRISLLQDKTVSVCFYTGTLLTNKML